MDCSMPGLPVHHQLQELAQTHGHRVSDVIQLSSVIPFSSHLQSFPMSHFFTSGGQDIGVSASVSVLLINIQSWFLLGLTGLISLLSKGLSRVCSSTIQRHHFSGTQSSLWSSSHICTWILEKPYLWLDRTLLAKWCFCFLICCLGLS